MILQIQAAHARASMLIDMIEKRGWKPDHITATAVLSVAAILSATIGNTREQFLAAAGRLFDTMNEGMAEP